MVVPEVRNPPIYSGEPQTSHRKDIDLGPYSTEKLCLRWLPNANEIDTIDMKCTCPTQEFCVWNPTQPIFL